MARFPTLIELESSALLVTVLPEVGGKLGQIREKTSGRDVLVPPQRPYRTIPPDGDWLQHDTSGMDDCFPNVAAGLYPEAPWASTRLPDLGEWTHSVWKVTKANARELAMEAAGNSLPYLATKTVGFVDERTLEFSYQVENRGQFPIRYLWSAHPLISVPSEYKLDIAPGDLMFRLFPADGQTRAWPAFNGSSLSTEWIPHGTDLKVFVTGMTEGWCALRLPTHTLRFTFDVRALPVVGLWFNNYGFPAGSDRPFRCIAVEPCTSPSDLLDELEPAAYPTIAAGGIAQWSMQLSISPHGLAEAE
jgi:hypothetical protein